MKICAKGQADGCHKPNYGGRRTGKTNPFLPLVFVGRMDRARKIGGADMPAPAHDLLLPVPRFWVAVRNSRLGRPSICASVAIASCAAGPSRRKNGSSTGIFRLSCVGRLYGKEKGHNTLLEVLARPQWRERPIEVSFYGSRSNAGGLEGMAEFFGLKKIRFHGFSDDVMAIWRENRVLIPPFRAFVRGAPLALGPEVAKRCER